jgi:hypothetical protein
MGANNRPLTTVTRSLSFDSDTFEMMEVRRTELRMDRSEFIRAILEDRLGIMSHPELNNVVNTLPSRLAAAQKQVDRKKSK